MPPALERKLAARQAFAASIDAALEGEGRGGAEQDWIEHATPGNDIPLAALLGSRNGWKLIKARPTVADLVLVRERGVLYAGTHGQGVWRLKVQWSDSSPGCGRRSGRVRDSIHASAVRIR